MRTYRITNRETRKTHDVEADSAQEACRRCGWGIGQCYVQDLGTKRAQALKEVKRASAEFALASALGMGDVVEIERLDRAVHEAAWRAFQAGCTFDEVHQAQVSAVAA